MAYLEEFRSRLAQRDYSKVLQLWQEYCQGDLIDGEEIVDILRLIKQSDFAKHLGQLIDTIIPLVTQIPEEEVKFEAFQLVFDIQTTNSPQMADLAVQLLKEKFTVDSQFNEKLRLIGLRNRDAFQGALSNFCLLNHIQKGNFVLHTAGWGVGEIVDFSFLREQVSIEFENLRGGKKDISFKNSFKTLIPLAKTHFLSRRFGEPDNLENEARANPVEVIRGLLKDLGPKSAQEIKDLISEYVIPEDDYSKWWQLARTKLKKDPLIEVPDNPKNAFKLRKGHASWDDRVQKAFATKKDFNETLSAAHNLIRDFPEILKNEKAKNEIVSKIHRFVESKSLSPSQTLQANLFLENSVGRADLKESIKKQIQSIAKIDEYIDETSIISLKKRLLMYVREYRKDWEDIFLHLLFTIDPNQLKDYLLKELSENKGSEGLKKRIKDLMEHPRKYPEAVVWYFQKVIAGDAPLYSDKEGQCSFFESFLNLFAVLDTKPEYRELSKKIYTLITGSRFELVRNMLKDSPLHFAKEFLLLASKCRQLNDHDQKIFRSLTEVAHPSLAKEQKDSAEDAHIIWTTQEGFQKTQERIKHIGTVEVVDNAREIEAARALGDLRENSEYKFALERRSRLQSELKMLSDQFQRARIITKEDIASDTVGVGTIVDLKNAKGEKVTYTILGPWDADPEKFILSYQSKFAQTMSGKKAGDSFSFKDDDFEILDIRSFL